MFKIVALTFLILLVGTQVPKINIKTQLPDLIINTEKAQKVYKSINVMETFQYQLEGFENDIQNKQNCKLLKPTLEITKDFQLSGVQPSEKENFYYSEKHQIVYRLNSKMVEVYKMSTISHKLQKMQSISLSQSACQKHGLFTENEDQFLIFNCNQILRINTETGGLQSKVIYKTEEKFNGFKSLHANGIIVWISSEMGIKLLGYNDKSELMQLNSLKFEHITDGVYHKGNLYLLNQKNFIHILQKEGTKNFKQIKTISLEQINGNANNYKILMWNDNIYVYSIEQGQQYITQLYLENDTCYLVRFFKGFYNLINFDIVDGRLFVATETNINFFQINRDPRRIHNIYNSVSYQHVKELAHISRIYHNKYFQVFPQSIHLIQLKMTLPTLQCLFKKSKNMQIQVTESCLQKYTAPFYKQCDQKTLLQIQVHSPITKLHIYAIAAVFLFSLAFILFMMAWRNGKIQIIRKLVNQVNRLASQNHQQIEFVEESVEKQIQWNDIKDLADGQFKAQQEEKHEGELKVDQNEIVETQRYMKQ